jgi:putative membrane protein
MNRLQIQKLKIYGVKLLTTTFAIVFSAWMLQKGIHIGDPKLLTGFIVAIVLLFINVFFKPVLVALTIPFTLATFGLFLLIINALVILLIDFLVEKFTVDSFWWALWFSLLVSITTSIIDAIGNLKVVRYNRPKEAEEEFTDYEEV